MWNNLKLLAYIVSSVFQTVLISQLEWEFGWEIITSSISKLCEYSDPTKHLNLPIKFSHPELIWVGQVPLVISLLLFISPSVKGKLKTSLLSSASLGEEPWPLAIAQGLHGNADVHHRESSPERKLTTLTPSCLPGTTLCCDAHSWAC